MSTTDRSQFDAQRRAWLAGLSAGAFALAVPGGAFGQSRQAARRQRVIVVGGSIAETVYALGGEQSEHYELVATDTTCTYPEAVRALPKVGYQRSLSTEGLLSLRPDLLLAAAEAGPPVVIEQIKRAGVTVQAFAERYDAEIVREKITGIARTFKMTEAGKTLLARFDRDWAAVNAKAAPLHGGAPPKVVFLHGNNQSFVAGQLTAADSMIAYAGGRNAMQGYDRYRLMTAEAVVAAAPDLVMISDEGLQAAGGPEALLAMPGFAATPAGRAKRVVSLSALLLLGFGPRLPQAVTMLRERFVAALA